MKLSAKVQAIRDEHAAKDSQPDDLESDEPLVKGELVRLASGGPVMTVLLNDEDLITCAWFAAARDGTQVPNLAVYPAYALTGVNENELYQEK